MGAARVTVQKFGLHIECDGVALHNRCIMAHGIAIHLTKMEYKILLALMLRMNRCPLPMIELYEWIYFERDNEPNDPSNVLAVMIVKVKRKITPLGLTIPNRGWNYGYALEQING